MGLGIGSRRLFEHLLDRGGAGRDDPELCDLTVVVQEQVVQFAEPFADVAWIRDELGLDELAA